MPTPYNPTANAKYRYNPTANANTGTLPNCQREYWVPALWVIQAKWLTLALVCYPAFGLDFGLL